MGNLIQYLGGSFEEVEVWFFGGQSNMEGAAPNASLLPGYTFPLNFDRFVGFGYGVEKWDIAGTSKDPFTSHAWDAYYLSDIEANVDTSKIIILKVAVSGSGISEAVYQWWTKGSILNQLEDLYNQLKDYLIDLGKIPKVTRVYWTQGEAELSTQQTLDDFTDNMNVLKGNFEKILGNDFKWIITKLSDNQTFWPAANIANIQGQQSNFTDSDIKYTAIGTDNCSMQGDNVHFDAPGYKQISDNVISIIGDN